VGLFWKVRDRYVKRNKGKEKGSKQKRCPRAHMGKRQTEKKSSHPT